MQGEDGKHLLNHALTVTIPAGEAEKRKTTKKKPAKAVKKVTKKHAISKKKVEKKPVGLKRDVVADNDDEDDVEMGEKPAEVATATKNTTQVNRKQAKSDIHAPSDHEDTSDLDVEVGPIPSSRDAKQNIKKPAKSKLTAAPTFQATAQGSMKQKSRGDMLIYEGDTTDDDLPVWPIHLSKKSNNGKEAIKVSRAHKRKLSEQSFEDNDQLREHHNANSRKKARTGTTVNVGVTARPSSRTKAPLNTKEVSFRANYIYPWQH